MPPPAGVAGRGPGIARRPLTAIDWLDGGTSHLPCPACAGTAPKPWKLTVEAPAAAPLTLVECPACGAAFYEGAIPAVPVTDHAGALQFYVEQGAGLDVMIAPLFQIPAERVRRYLEVGCGFGYALDFVRWAFGWMARGVDPSPLAAEGRRILGLDISSGYLAADADPARGRNDLVFGSEVIEHVSDPRAFVHALGSHLAPNGALILTTPDARAIRPGVPGAMLLSVLSPGHHLVLFTPAALRHVLVASGFPHVTIQESPGSLVAVASRQSYPLRGEATVDRALYRRYLAHRSRTHRADSPVGLGFSYRLFKECVNAAAFREAVDAFALLRAGCLTRHGLDLARPGNLELGPAVALSFEEFAAAYPFNLTGALFFQGILEMNHHRRDRAALDCFRAAAAAGAAVRGALRGIGADDRETENLTQLARAHAAYCLAGLDPEAALRELSAMEGQTGAGDGPGRPPAEFAPTPRIEVFIRLVNAGHYASAERLAPAVAEAFGLGDRPFPIASQGGARHGAAPRDERAMSAAFCLGVLALNHQGQAARAAALFGLVHDEARTALGRGSGDPVASALLWPARYSQALALGRTGDHRACEAAARSLVDPGADAASFPPVPADLVASAQRLLA
ncbi:MAG TPA: class I SAM-dependent methyltransferase [Candidatus Binatia bacterium]|nr:class I SAM-dependent methyltransferase [Candidatus Binatia bacterium]